MNIILIITKKIEEKIKKKLKIIVHILIKMINLNNKKFEMYIIVMN